MRTYSLSHLSDHTLLRRLTRLVQHDRRITAAMLAHIAEVDARMLHLPAGYPSMHAYCVQRLRLSEDAALKRIQAARVARQFPIIFTALEEGRLHLSGVCLLAPYLKEAAAFCESMADASLEERVRAALGYLRPRASSRGHAIRVGTAA